MLSTNVSFGNFAILGTSECFKINLDGVACCTSKPDGFYEYKVQFIVPGAVANKTRDLIKHKRR